MRNVKLLHSLWKKDHVRYGYAIKQSYYHCGKRSKWYVCHRLPFNAHIDVTTSKTLARLGCIERTCRHFHDELALKLLYFTQLVYASLLWRDNSLNQSRCLLKVQNSFLQFLCFQRNVEFLIFRLVLFLQ